MKIGIGTDIIACTRFAHFNKKELVKFFTANELQYCSAEPVLELQRLAVRYAAKEAAYKAIFSLLPETNLTFSQFLPHIEIEKNTYTRAPILLINWTNLGIHQKIHASISLSHTPEYANATVLLYGEL